ncbi:MAG TPA: LodA/GoxA family CTQ-dependent oxidase [Verrucomicrobiae bacterium]|nr:LodA/GoxA family CTQ-dependent oxidase [Verrucomicrobiae bacterium]
MSKTYRIYPGIGIARLGNHPDSFILAPEIPGVGPLELTADDAVQPVAKYKLGQMIRRQAARFRVFEFDTDAAGQTTSREVNLSTGAQIEWRVELANEKASAGWFVSENVPEDVNKPRNPGVPQADLIIKPIFPPISGAAQKVAATSEGKFKGQIVVLGELRTDAKGRLLILGGSGRSASVPAGLPLGDGSQGPSGANSFANNEGWFDDVSDGPISATVTIPGQVPVVISNGAWVIVAPPDFAPYNDGITTMFDIVTQATGTQPPTVASFQNHVLPILKAFAKLRYVSQLPVWGAISTDYVQLSKKDAAADQLRKDTLQLLLSIENNFLVNFNFTTNQRQILNNWANGDFNSDFTPNPLQPPLTPDNLDRASLSQSVGGGFFPGIEAGIRMTSPKMYSAPFRITMQPFTFNNIPQTPRAGFITRTMACPWQSDFFECAEQSPTTVWWPAQRPINVFVDPQAQVQKPWIDSIPDHQSLVDNFAKLGFVEPFPGGAAEPLVEAERDPSIPHL